MVLVDLVLFCDRNLELLLPARSNWIKRYCLLCCSACRLDKGGVLEWAELVGAAASGCSRYRRRGTGARETVAELEIKFERARQTYGIVNFILKFSAEV